MRKYYLCIIVGLLFIFGCNSESSDETEDLSIKYLKTLEHFDGDNFDKYQLKGIAVDMAGNVYLGIYHYKHGGIYKYPANTSELWNETSPSNKLKPMGTYISKGISDDMEGVYYSQANGKEYIYFSYCLDKKIFRINTELTDPAEEFVSADNTHLIGSDNEGNIYNAIPGVNYIFKYNNSGKLLNNYSVDRLPDFAPHDIAINREGVIYIANISGNYTESLIKFSVDNDDILSIEWNISNGIDNDLPGFGIATDNKYVFMADDKNNKVNVYNKSGNLEIGISTLGDTGTSLGTPYRLFVDSRNDENILYILSIKDDRIQIHLFNY